MKTENKKEKGNPKGLHKGILKTWALHKELGLREVVNTETKDKTKCLHSDAQNRMCDIVTCVVHNKITDKLCFLQC